MRRLCDADGWAEVDLVAGEIGDRFVVLATPCRAGRTRGAVIFDRKLRWMDQKTAVLIELAA